MSSGKLEDTCGRMDSLRIRTATSEDAPTISRLLDQLGYPNNAAAIPERIDKLHARPGTAVLVAEDDRGELLGMVTVHLFQALHADEPAAWLTAVVVEESARGQGVGSALVRHAEDWAIKHGALRISLTSALRRKEAHEFYKARDYRHTGVRLTKVFVNRSGAAHRDENWSSRGRDTNSADNQPRA